MSRGQTFVIVGAGLAGAKAAEALRTEGFLGRVVLFGEEAERPYNRPPLSKDFLQGKSDREEIYVHPAEWYAEHDVDLQVATQVTAIDRSAHEVLTADGGRISYDKLLLATGSSPRLLTVPGSDLEGVFYLRRVEDSEAIKIAFGTSKQVVIIGAGWIGLETAAAARAAGCAVTVIETAELPLLAVLGKEVAEIYAALHRRHGVELRLGAKLAALVGEGQRVIGVRLADDTVIEADVVVVGVGITPNSELAEAAGLVVDNGVLVDEHLVTSDPDVFAAGDVANAFYPLLDTHLRLEHWSAALNQGPVAASNMMGRTTAYDEVPYFYSDQYEMGMEYAGFVGGEHYDEVIFRGDVSTGAFIAFWTKDRRVLAGMNVNVWEINDGIQALVRSGAEVNLAKLADAAVPLDKLAHRSPSPALQ